MFAQLDEQRLRGYRNFSSCHRLQDVAQAFAVAPRTTRGCRLAIYKDHIATIGIPERIDNRCRYELSRDQAAQVSGPSEPLELSCFLVRGSCPPPF